jgi:hypothetical protein
MWRVTVRAHRVGPNGRYSVAASTLDVPAFTSSAALRYGIDQAQRAAGCPPWKPIRRESVPHAEVEAL